MVIGRMKANASFGVFVYDTPKTEEKYDEVRAELIEKFSK